MDSGENIIQKMNRVRPVFFDLLGANVVAADPQAQSCVMTFDISHDYCHSGDIVQGGFVTAMLDAVTTHAVFAADASVTGVSTLELKVSFLEATRAGRVKATGRVQRAGRSIVFLTGELLNSDDVPTACVSATAKLGRAQ